MAEASWSTFVKFAPQELPLKNQSVQVPGTKRPGQTAHYRNAVFGLLDINDPSNLTNLTDAFENALKAGRDRPFLGHRPLLSTSPRKFADTYVWQTYGQVDIRRRHIGSALYKLFTTGALGGGDMETVGIWAPNSPEWQILDLSCGAYKKVAVSLYDTLGVDSVEYIINHAHLTIVFASSDHLSELLRLKAASKVPMLNLVVSIDDTLPKAAHDVLGAWGKSVGVQVMTLKEFEKLGEENLRAPIPATFDQIASMCYTSGTTSNPKGALLTHGHLAISVQSNLCGIVLTDDMCLLSYLPLAHIYGRICEICIYALCGRIGYSTGDPLRLVEDAQILKPTFFPSVPRVLNRLYQAAMAAGTAPGLKGLLFRKAVETKLQKLKATGDWTHVFWDRLVFKKIQAVLGGNIMLITCGSAPINAAVIDFLKIAFSCHVEEGIYGMTENSATCSRASSYDPNGSGTVGAPQPCNEVKLVDVPEMGYFSDDKPNPRGEICGRGPNCFSQYYKDEKNTKSTIDEEGWLHTGDVGEFDECGRLKVIDRIKNIMKLAQGEYVALEKIENLYSASSLLQQIYIHGDSLQSYLIAVVVPDPVHLASVVSSTLHTNVQPTADSLQPFLNEPAVKEKFLSLLNKTATKNSLKGFEIIKRIHLTFDLFSVDDGTLTPTMKIKRKDAYLKHKAALDALYALGEPTSSSPSTKL